MMNKITREIFKTSTLPINEKMIVSKYLNNYDFKAFINTFNLNTMYFTSYNYITLNLFQNYTQENILHKINNLINDMPNLNEIIIKINLDSSLILSLDNKEFVERIFKIINYYNTCNVKKSLNIVFNKPKLYIDCFNFNMYVKHKQIIEKYITITKLSKSTLFYFIIDNTNFINLFNEINKDNFKNISFIYYVSKYTNINKIPKLDSLYYCICDNKLTKNIVYNYQQFKNYTYKYKNKLKYIYDENKNRFIYVRYDNLLNDAEKIPLIYEIIKNININNNDKFYYLNNINKLFQLNKNKIFKSNIGTLNRIVQLMNVYKYILKYNKNIDIDIKMINEKLKSNFYINVSETPIFSQIYKLVKINRYMLWYDMLYDIKHLN